MVRFTLSERSNPGVLRRRGRCLAGAALALPAAVGLQACGLFGGEAGSGPPARLTASDFTARGEAADADRATGPEGVPRAGARGDGAGDSSGGPAGSGASPVRIGREPGAESAEARGPRALRDGVGGGDGGGVDAAEADAPAGGQAGSARSGSATGGNAHGESRGGEPGTAEGDRAEAGSRGPEGAAGGFGGSEGGSEARDGGGAASPQRGRTMVADAIVGDVNGRPIYASAFFEELDARFRAEAGQVERNEFLAMAQREIRRKLNEVVERELLRAEAIASLPEEAREYGVQSFLRRVRENTIRERGGTRSTAERAVGGDLDRYARQQTERQLIQYQFREEISQRINVSWREIQQAYERQHGRFNPDPEAQLRWIRVRRSAEADVEAIEGALASGRPFEEVASMPANGFQPEVGGLLSKSFEGPYEEATFIALESVNEAAQGLEPGEVAGPIESGRFVNWIKLEGIQRRETPLYDVQSVLETARRRQLGQRELARYIQRLKERASFTDVDEMTARLLRIAAERYLPEQDGDAGDAG